MSKKLPDLPRSCFAFWHQAQVRHSDGDSNGHVNNAVYAQWLDDARYELLHPRLVPGLEPGDFLALVTLQIDFVKETRFGDRPEVGSVLTRLTARSITLDQAVWAGPDLVARSRSVTVIANRITARARELSDRQRLTLNGLALAPGSGGELVS